MHYALANPTGSCFLLTAAACCVRGADLPSFLPLVFQGNAPFLFFCRAHKDAMHVLNMFLSV